MLDLFCVRKEEKLNFLRRRQEGGRRRVGGDCNLKGAGLCLLHVWKGQGETMNGGLAERSLGAGVSEGGFSTFSLPRAVRPSSITPAPIFSKV